MAAVAIETLRVAMGGAQHPFPVVSLVDRRKTPARRKQFALTRGLERVLYGVTSGRSTGAWAAHLAKHDLEDAVLVADKAAVAAGTLTQAELDAGASHVPAPCPCPRPPSGRRTWHVRLPSAPCGVRVRVPCVCMGRGPSAYRDSRMCDCGLTGSRVSPTPSPAPAVSRRACVSRCGFSRT